MKLMKLNRKILLVLASVIVLAALPAMSTAQGRGRDRDRREQKKLDKFVNGHDARDGRWDARGTRIGRRNAIKNDIFRQRRADRIRNRDFNRENQLRNGGLWRRRALNNDRFLRSQRMRHRRFERRSFTRRY